MADLRASAEDLARLVQFKSRILNDERGEVVVDLRVVEGECVEQMRDLDGAHDVQVGGEARIQLHELLGEQAVVEAVVHGERLGELNEVVDATDSVQLVQHREVQSVVDYGKLFLQCQRHRLPQRVQPDDQPVQVADLPLGDGGDEQFVDDVRERLSRVLQEVRRDGRDHRRLHQLLALDRVDQTVTEALLGDAVIELVRGQEAQHQLETRVVLNQLYHVHEDQLLEASDHVFVLHAHLVEGLGEVRQHDDVDVVHVQVDGVREDALQLGR